MMGREGGGKEGERGHRGEGGQSLPLATMTMEPASPTHETRCSLPAADKHSMDQGTMSTGCGLSATQSVHVM